MRGKKDAYIPKGALAYREYGLSLRDGSPASIAITLANPNVDSVPSRFAREHGAVAHGLLSVLFVPGAPTYPLIWLHDTRKLSVAMAEDEGKLPGEVQAIIAEYLDIFLQETAHLVPELADVRVDGRLGARLAANDNAAAS